MNSASPLTVVGAPRHHHGSVVVLETDGASQEIVEILTDGEEEVY